MSQSHTEKIAKLLAQAEGAGTEAEAAVFTEKAQQLATLYSIDLAKARHINVAKERTTPIQRTITLGVKGTRGLNTLIGLIGGIADANEVTYNIAHNSTYIIAFGFEEDIDTVEALYGSLVVQMAQAAAAYRKEDSWKAEKVWRDGGYRKVKIGTDPWGDPEYDYNYVPGGYVDPSWLGVRLDFQEGFARRIGARLATAKFEAEKQSRADDTESSTGTELVLVEKREAVRDFYKANSRARGSYKGYRQINSHAAHQAGSRAASNARLSNATAFGGAKKAIA